MLFRRYLIHDNPTAMKATFDHTISILVQAYLNDTLAHKLCTACAVGNLIGDAMGTKQVVSDYTSCTEFDCWKYENGEYAHWYRVLCDEPVLDEAYEIGLRQIKSTGYSVEEIKMIENAFEEAPGDPGAGRGMFRGRCTDPNWMFNGLMAVVEVLAEIHGVDLTQKESAKMLFVKG